MIDRLANEAAKVRAGEDEGKVDLLLDDRGLSDGAVAKYDDFVDYVLIEAAQGSSILSCRHSRYI